MTSRSDADDRVVEGDDSTSALPPLDPAHGMDIVGSAEASGPTAASTATSTVINVTPPAKERAPLNPAIAILVGAVLTATSGVTAAYLSIRSSERLSNERAKTDTAVKASTELQRKVDQLERDLSDAARQLSTLASTTAPSVSPAPTAAPPPSIVVVVAAPSTLAPAPSTAAPTTRPASTTAAPTTVPPPPPPAAVAPVAAPSPTTAPTSVPGSTAASTAPSTTSSTSTTTTAKP